ncbi:hypothetical protein FJTKL_04408 [Diaporthe vaccinii]|uniref:Secreted protein n=1 Tax=Diaporthe vaccinii TaxID=105482 RepID=A0ABR4DT50_9PEZI
MITVLFRLIALLLLRWYQVRVSFFASCTLWYRPFQISCSKPLRNKRADLPNGNKKENMRENTRSRTLKHCNPNLDCRQVAFP